MCTGEQRSQSDWITPPRQRRYAIQPGLTPFPARPPSEWGQVRENGQRPCAMGSGAGKRPTPEGSGAGKRSSPVRHRRPQHQRCAQSQPGVQPQETGHRNDSRAEGPASSGGFPGEGYVGPSTLPFHFHAIPRPVAQAGMVRTVGAGQGWKACLERSCGTCCAGGDQW